MKTYTHTGGQPHVGYRHRGTRLWGHCGSQAGRAHALNRGKVGTFGYVALCGAKVAAAYEDHYTGDRVTKHVRPVEDAAAVAVTCERCRKRLGS